MITASQQIDRVADSLTQLVRSRAVPVREIKSLVLRLDRVANSLDQRNIKASSGRSGSATTTLMDIANQLIHSGLLPRDVTSGIFDSYPSISPAEVKMWINAVRMHMKKLRKQGS